jgi:hypothetical protein
MCSPSSPPTVLQGCSEHTRARFARSALYSILKIRPRREEAGLRNVSPPRALLRICVSTTNHLRHRSGRDQGPGLWRVRRHILDLSAASSEITKSSSRPTACAPRGRHARIRRSPRALAGGRGHAQAVTWAVELARYGGALLPLPEARVAVRFPRWTGNLTGPVRAKARIISRSREMGTP